MVSEYIGQDDCLILVAISMSGMIPVFFQPLISDDIENQGAARLARHFDKEGRRTIGRTQGESHSLQVSLPRRIWSPTLTYSKDGLELSTAKTRNIVLHMDITSPCSNVLAQTPPGRRPFRMKGLFSMHITCGPNCRNRRLQKSDVLNFERSSLSSSLASSGEGEYNFTRTF